MWSGVDSDVELYASGVVVEDDGEWAGGQSLEAPPVAPGEWAMDRSSWFPSLLSSMFGPPRTGV